MGPVLPRCFDAGCEHHLVWLHACTGGSIQHLLQLCGITNLQPRQQQPATVRVSSLFKPGWPAGCVIWLPQLNAGNAVVGAV
jgi:hypothetical protein